MNPFNRLAACLMAAGLAGASAVAQPAEPALQPQGGSAMPNPRNPGAPGVTLRAALDAAWARAVASRDIEGQRRRAEAERVAADTPWAAPPSLELSYRDDRLHGSAGRRETEIGVAVPLWLPGQRAARLGTADAAAAQALAAEQVARLHLAGELREAAWQIAALRTESARADSEAQVLKQLADDVDRRVRAGDLAPADSLAAQAERLSAATAQSDVRQRLRAAEARWTWFTGAVTLPDPTEGAHVGQEPGALPLHPELRLARQSTELARKRVDVMRASRREAPELTLGLRHDVPGRAEPSQGSLAVAFRLPFGTDDRNRPMEAAALAELQVAETHEQRLRERVASDLATARDAERAAVAQLDTETARVDLLRQRAALIDKAFRAGEMSLPDLLRARAAAAQADSAVARQTAALGLARARLQQALGLLP